MDAQRAAEIHQELRDQIEAQAVVMRKASEADKENALHSHARNRMSSDFDKESSNCVVIEQKRLLFELERQLQREKTAASIATPSEFTKIMKRLDSEGLMHEIAELRLANAGLQTELKEVRWHHGVMQKHLPPSAREAVARELIAQPLPLHEQELAATP